MGDSKVCLIMSAFHRCAREWSLVCPWDISSWKLSEFLDSLPWSLSSPMHRTIALASPWSTILSSSCLCSSTGFFSSFWTLSTLHTCYSVPNISILAITQFSTLPDFSTWLPIWEAVVHEIFCSHINYTLLYNMSYKMGDYCTRYLCVDKILF